VSREIQDSIERIERGERQRSFIIRYVAIPYIIIYLAGWAYIIFFK
jgi:hypothetical protein